MIRSVLTHRSFLRGWRLLGRRRAAGGADNRRATRDLAFCENPHFGYRVQTDDHKAARIRAPQETAPLLEEKVRKFFRPGRLSNERIR